MLKLHPFFRNFGEKSNCYFFLKSIESLRVLRNIKIMPNMVGLDLDIHNGKYFINVDIKASMVGHKLGEFSLTKVTGNGTRLNRKKINKKRKKKK